MTNFIEVDGMSKRFGHKTIFSDLSFTVVGTNSILLGENGIGKSTMLRMMYGIEKPTKGRISILGFDPQSDTEKLREAVGYVPSEPTFPSYLRVRDLYDFASTYASVNEIDRLEAEVSLEYLRNVTPKSLSSGEKQGLSFIIAFCANKKAYLMDEPLSSIDLRRKLRILNLMKEYRGSLLISVHEMAEIMTLSGNAIRMYKTDLSEGAVVQHLHLSELNIMMSYLNYESNCNKMRELGIPFDSTPPVITISNGSEGFKKAIAVVSDDFIFAMRDMNE